nr:MAG TPA: hypothetical protein [Caudoviricetes sp.]
MEDIWKHVQDLRVFLFCIKIKCCERQRKEGNAFGSYFYLYSH